MSESSKPESDNGKREAISRRAYDLYERRGREEGHDVADWLEAEQEIADPAKTFEAAEYAEVIPLAGEADPKPDDSEDSGES